MWKIQLSDNLDTNLCAHHIGVGIDAVNDGSLEEGCWDMRMMTAENWLGADYGDGIVVDEVIYAGDMAVCYVTIHDYCTLSGRDSNPPERNRPVRGVWRA